MTTSNSFGIDISLLLLLFSGTCSSLLSLTIILSQMTYLIIVPDCKSLVNMKLSTAATALFYLFIVVRTVLDVEEIKEKLICLCKHGLCWVFFTGRWQFKKTQCFYVNFLQGCWFKWCFYFLSTHLKGTYDKETDFLSALQKYDDPVSFLWAASDFGTNMWFNKPFVWLPFLCRLFCESIRADWAFFGGVAKRDELCGCRD